MNLRTALAILIAILAGVWDACVSIWLPAPLDAIRFVLPLAVVLVAFSSSKIRGPAVALAGGVAFDVLAPSNAGFMTLRIFIVALAVAALTARIFTTRSFMAAATIGIAAALIDRVLLIAFEMASTAVGRTVIMEARPSLLASTAWTALVVMAFFYAFAAFGKRFLPVVSRFDRTARIPAWKS
jgi:hypothetical protein